MGDEKAFGLDSIAVGSTFPDRKKKLVSGKGSVQM